MSKSLNRYWGQRIVPASLDSCSLSEFKLSSGTDLRLGSNDPESIVRNPRAATLNGHLLCPSLECSIV